MSLTFKAQVQYQDWEGTAAADGHQGHDFEEFLKGNQLMGPNETLIALSLSVIQGSVHVHAVVVDRTGYNSAKDLVEGTNPIPVRRVDLNLTLQEFFSHLKRFNAVLTWNTLDLTGREYEEKS
jgi:hypothetical protein